LNHGQAQASAAIGLAVRIERVLASFGEFILSHIEGFPIANAVTADGTAEGSERHRAERARAVRSTRRISCVALFGSIDLSVSAVHFGSQKGFVEFVNGNVLGGNRVNAQILQDGIGKHTLERSVSVLLFEDGRDTANVDEGTGSVGSLVCVVLELGRGAGSDTDKINVKGESTIGNTTEIVSVRGGFGTDNHSEVVGLHEVIAE